ncbi:hypothetical protein C8F04DRAFT_1113819 [Mycena alexandri]|uniref:Uncharacterized protein n=1 Tax=Mycena alexandri TaxID=1745969 RepID=A0AAD6SLP3_9AGAR|nr:hypothetical protein C8F04DRAFT_1119951 [Mycena alexandri]KAJ7030241.1 hypothetical protein C8F04DRAFT_1113819 [Mycena alexandri]
MFATASIAFACILLLPQIAVKSAPVHFVRDFEFTLPAFVPQFCTAPELGGTCTPLNNGTCTPTPGVQSLSLAQDAECTAFTSTDCSGQALQQPQFSDNSLDLSALNIASVQCSEVANTVNGLQAGSAASIAHQQADSEAAAGIVSQPAGNCTEGPVQASAAEQAEAAANGIPLSGPVTCTF